MRAKIFATTFFVYAAVVLAVTQLPIQRHPAAYWSDEPWWVMLKWIPGDVDAPSFILNVIMFIPFGVLAPLLWRSADSMRRLARYALLASGGIELTQFIFMITLGSRRTVDVNDLIANTAGALLGLWILRLALPRTDHRRIVRP